ncbi:DUF501 domain-containing protein [Actinomycetospora lutea]|uniref:DUF501 domain-containing protein n=1 Tax=Actinomycetospora lutea TaxID=663604 RepID=UPI002365DF79|nr:DUF501 domain-containing protein [Actinomycetospora lutea]MDD7937682.1 DUF501 domain-containing protein [Actinomycetospora lutea]
MSGPDDPPTDADRAAVAAQIGRRPRGLRRVAHRCPCGLPDVVETAPRLEDGTPFPTLYYATCPRLTSRIGTLEADGLMREQTERLDTDPDFAARYARAHAAYLAERDAIEPLGTAVSAGGMPERVKCLHVHVAHTLARGRGVNPAGDDTLDRLDDWWHAGPCVSPAPGDPSG